MPVMHGLLAAILVFSAQGASASPEPKLKRQLLSLENAALTYLRRLRAEGVLVGRILLSKNGGTVTASTASPPALPSHRMMGRRE